MSDPDPLPSIATLVAELDQVRVVGPMDTRRLELKSLSRLGAHAGYSAGPVIEPDELEKLLRDAIRTFDESLESSAAWLFGVARNARILTLQARTKKAGGAIKPRNILERSYRGNKNKSHQRDDIDHVAEALIALAKQARPIKAADAPAAVVAVPSTNDPPAPTPTLLVTLDPPDAVAQYLDDHDADYWFASRIGRSKELWSSLQDGWDREVRALGKPSQRLTIFVAGSYGRREASDHSDLDVFLVADAPGSPKETHGTLSRFEVAHALTIVDRCRHKLSIQQFSQKGYFLEPHSLRTMLAEIGGQEDASSNRMIARLLLLVNSRPLHNPGLHSEMRSLVLDEYWAGPEDRPFRPAHLMSDLRRLWLTMVVNFEHFYPRSSSRPSVLRKRRIANLKLQMSQRLGCFTPIFCMLAHSTSDGLTKSAANRLLGMTTLERLDDLVSSPVTRVSESARKLRTLYGQYLGFTNCARAEMELRIADPAWKEVKQYFSQSHTLAYELLAAFYEEVPTVAKFSLA